VQFKPLRGTALMIFNPDLVFLMVDNLFGGDGRFHTSVEGRDFTQTEHRIMSKDATSPRPNTASSSAS